MWHLSRRPRWAALLVGVVGALTASGCGGGGADVSATPVAAVELSTDAVTVRVGAEAPVVARVTDETGRELVGRPVFWSVRDTLIASVSQSGVVRGLAPGATEVSANVQGRSAVAAVTVAARTVAGVLVDPASVQLTVGAARTLTARAVDETGATLPGAARWSSSNSAVATVTDAGVVTAVGAGVATVTATIDGRSADVAVAVGLVPATSLRIAPATDTLAVGATRQLTATAFGANGAALAGRSPAWTSRAPGVVAVSSSGQVTAVSAGTAVIVASLDGVNAEATIVVRGAVVASVQLTPPASTLSVGGTVQLVAVPRDQSGNALAGRTVTFASSDAGVAKVESNGVVTAVAPGTATIRATSEGASATATITVSPLSVSRVDVSPGTATLTVGETTTLTATPRAADGTALAGRAVTWTSGGPSVATVSSSGVVTAVGPGTAVIQATVDGVTGSATITVPAPPAPPAPPTPPGPQPPPTPPPASWTLTVTPATANINVDGPQSGRRVDLTAVLRDGNGNVVTNVPVVWTSSAPGVATVSSTGTLTARVQAVSVGTTTITATAQGATAQARITVGTR